MKLIKDLRQRHLEAWEREFNRIRGDDKGVSTYHGAVVRAALAAGWFGEDGDPDTVDDMTPREVRKLSADVDSLYAEVTTLDPN
jgi:hypothetical protein